MTNGLFRFALVACALLFTQNSSALGRASVSIYSGTFCAKTKLDVCFFDVMSDAIVFDCSLNGSPSQRAQNYQGYGDVTRRINLPSKDTHSKITFPQGDATSGEVLMFSDGDSYYELQISQAPPETTRVSFSEGNRQIFEGSTGVCPMALSVKP